MGAKIYNSDVTKSIINQIKLATSMENPPNEIADKVICVLNVSPFQTKTSKPLKTLTGLSNQTSATVYTCNAIKETYLTSATLNYIKDVTSTATDIALNIIDDESNVVSQHLRFKGITLTANSGSISWSSPFPIKLKKGSNITITSDTNVANVLATCTLLGFEIDNL
jgi:hypothetical protein